MRNTGIRIWMRDDHVTQNSMDAVADRYKGRAEIEGERGQIRCHELAHLLQDPALLVLIQSSLELVDEPVECWVRVVPDVRP